MRQNSLRLNIPNVLFNLQVLYQNNQIDAETRAKLATMLQDCLSNDTSKPKLASELRKIKNNIDAEFKDIVYDCLTIIE